MGATFEFSLPPISALAFLPFIFLQAVLLQPIFPERTSRILRFLLTFPAVYYSAIAPFRYRIEPEPYAIGANFRWGIFGPNFIMKALEWGLARDRSPFSWIGFDEKPKSDKTITLKTPLPPHGSTSTPAGSASTPVDAVKLDRGLKKRSTRRRGSSHLPTPPDSPTSLDSPATVVPSDIGIAGPVAFIQEPLPVVAKTLLQTVLDALHLITAMRGIGYAFGAPVLSLAGREGPPPPLAHKAFAKRAILILVRSHIISTICLILLIHRNDLVPNYLRTYLYLTPYVAQSIANILAYLSVGFSLHAQMLIGFEGASLVFLALHYLPKPFKIPFDAREWPPLFIRPFEMTSVTEFWGKQWHALFRKPFTSVGYEPVEAVSKTLLGRKIGKQIGRMLGAITVFGLSAWLHDQGLWSARHGLSLSLISRLTFTQRHGANLFFLLQSFCVILEQAFRALTGKKVSGPIGRFWSLLVIVGGGCFAGRSWIALGLVEGLPGVDQWDWERWVLPTVALAPPPLYVK